MVEPRLVPDLMRVRYQSAKDQCQVNRFGIGRRADPHMSCKAVRQPNCCRVVKRDVWGSS